MSLDETETEETVDGYTSSSSTSREDMLHLIGRVEVFVAGRNNQDDCLPHVHKVRALYSTRTSMDDRQPCEFVGVQSGQGLINAAQSELTEPVKHVYLNRHTLYRIIPAQEHSYF